MPVFNILMQASRFPLLDSYIHRVKDGFGVPWQAAIELFLIGIVIYAALRFLEGTRGARLMLAVLTLLIAFLVVAIIAQILELDRIVFLYPYFVGGVFLIALVVFQPELRRGLMRIGETIGWRSRSAESAKLIEPVVQMAASLSKRKIGALIAIERVVPLGGIMETGVRIDGEVTRELLETIFWPGSALHDLGVIISHGKVAAAGCEFPLAEADAANRIIGSRHRAALGMSLEADALIVVVSEETGIISIARRGVLHRPLTTESLREMLIKGLLVRKPEDVAEEEGEQPAPEGEAAEVSASSPGGKPVVADQTSTGEKPPAGKQALAATESGN